MLNKTVFVALIFGVLAGTVNADESNEEVIKERVQATLALNEIDSDQDGLVSEEEFKQYRAQGENKQTMSAFASFDKDKDGYISEQELSAHARYSNPGNGTGTLLDDKREGDDSADVDGSKKEKKNKEKSNKKEKNDRSDKGKNKDK